MFILSVLLTAAFMSVSGLRESANVSEARKKLDEIEQALYGFAAANNHLPCPAIPGNGGVANQPNAASNCASSLNISDYIGFVPSTTLGIKGRVNCDGLLLDPWGRPYRYSVANTDTGNGFADFVVSGDISAEGMSNVTASTIGYRICNNTLQNCASASALSIVSDNAVAVVFSMGSPRANSSAENENAGEGGASAASSCGLANYELGNDRRYYSSTRIEQAGSEFDDIVIWLSPNILFNKMLDANLLP